MRAASSATLAGAEGFSALGFPRPAPGEVLRDDFRKLGELLPISTDALPSRPASRRVVVRFASSAPCWGTDETPAWLDMAGVDLSLLNTGRAPLLLDHNRDFDSLVGVVERAWVEGDAAFAMVRFAGSAPRARRALALVREGVLSNVSMGLYLLRETAGDPLTANRVRWWRPFEVSLCTVPADWTARVWRLIPDRTAVEGSPA